MEEENNRARNIIDRIKLLLFNYDMTIAYIQGEIDLRKSVVAVLEKENEDGKSKTRNKKIITNKADLEIYNVFLNDILSKRANLMKNLDAVFGRFKNPYLTKKVFYAYFIKEYTIEKIAKDLVFINENQVKAIIDKIQSLIINLFQ